MVFTNQEINKIDELARQVQAKSMTVDQAVLELRGGDGNLGSAAVVLLFVMFINWMSGVRGFSIILPPPNFQNPRGFTPTINSPPSRPGDSKALKINGGEVIPGANAFGNSNPKGRDISPNSSEEKKNNKVFESTESTNNLPDYDDSTDDSTSDSQGCDWNDFIHQVDSEPVLSDVETVLDNYLESDRHSDTDGSSEEVDSLDYDPSDSEEVDDEEFDFQQDKELYPNRKSKGFQVAQDDTYQGAVYQYKYATTPERLARYERREIFANKKEEILFSTPRTEEDLDAASKVELSDRRLTDKVWRHPGYFNLERPPKGSASSRTPKIDFFSKHRSSVREILKEHLTSPNTRCFRNGFYREQNIPYDFYYNNVTGKIILVTAETQEVFSFWTISKMQRLELFNHNHIHKHWKLIDEINKKTLEFQKQEEAKAQHILNENRLNQVVSNAEAARRASQQIEKDIKNDNNP